jgi:hypothetical protein
MNVVTPPFALRIMNSSPPPGFTSRMTCAEPAVRAARIITPALAYAFVFCTDVMRATIWLSPEMGCETN